MSTKPCYACGKDVSERTISLCGICSRPICRKCEVVLGDWLLCPECDEHGDPAEE